MIDREAYEAMNRSLSTFAYDSQMNHLSNRFRQWRIALAQRRYLFDPIFVVISHGS
jgi:hypothetical protein